MLAGTQRYSPTNPMTPWTGDDRWPCCSSNSALARPSIEVPSGCRPALRDLFRVSIENVGNFYTSRLSLLLVTYRLLFPKIKDFRNGFCIEKKQKQRNQGSVDCPDRRMLMITTRIAAVAATTLV